MFLWTKHKLGGVLPPECCLVVTGLWSLTTSLTAMMQKMTQCILIQAAECNKPCNRQWARKRAFRQSRYSVFR